MVLNFEEKIIPFKYQEKMLKFVFEENYNALLRTVLSRHYFINYRHFIQQWIFRERLLVGKCEQQQFQNVCTFTFKLYENTDLG